MYHFLSSQLYSHSFCKICLPQSQLHQLIIKSKNFMMVRGDILSGNQEVTVRVTTLDG